MALRSLCSGDPLRWGFFERLLELAGGKSVIARFSTKDGGTAPPATLLELRWQK